MMPSSQKTPAELLHKLSTSFDDLQQRIDLLQQEIASLEDQGILNASVWMKSGKYLYLVYPTDDQGNRRRDYIGNDPEKMQAATAAIERHKQWSKLLTKLTVLQEKQRHAVQRVSHILYELKSVQLDLWRTS